MNEQVEQAELMEVEKAVEACNAVAVPDQVRVALVRDLKPVANRLAKYAVDAAMEVTNKEQADEAAQIFTMIAADIDTVKNHEVLEKITDVLHKLHRQWTGLRDLFIAPMEQDRRTIKGKIITWQEGERRKAEELNRNLQAEAEAKAAREREAMLKKAASLKTPEKAEALRQQAAQVIAPTINIEAPKTGLRVSKAWAVKNIDMDGFYAALATRQDLRGFVEINNTRLVRAKAANPNMEVPGVVFEQVMR
ncbi:MAG: hypothetical protein PHW65_00175 [Dehalococcoidales bacterium]|nr:hypothetical protein [Dehalococcoidales bacterium]